MEKKKWVKLAGFAMVFLLSLFLCVGCAENSAEDDRLVTVSFVSSFEDSSRGGLSQEYTDLYVPENLYWTYTAVKTSGIHSTGASEKDRDGKLIEQPVHGDRGFSGSLHEFSKGGWNFTLYGYIDKIHTQLVYEAEKEIDLAASTAVVFDSLTAVAVADGGVIGEKGCLELGSLCVRIPDNGLAIAVDSIVVVEIYDESGAIVASSETVIDNASYYTSKRDVVTVNTPIFIEGKNLFETGVKTLTAKVKCRNFPRPGANYEETMMGIFPIVFASKAGVVTKVSGTLGDLALKPIGGTIFHVATTTGAGSGAVYTFYDVNGNVLTTTTTVAGLANAKYYSIEGVASKDKYYVYNGNVKSPERLYHYGLSGTRSGNVPEVVVQDTRIFKREEVAKPGSSDNVWWRGDTNISAFPKDNSVGWGRRNTEFFMSGAWNAAWFVNHEGTVWNYLKNNVNNPNIDNGTCWYDWYVPSAGEVLYLYSYSNSLARGDDGFGLGSSTGCHSTGAPEICAGFFGVFFNGGRSNVLYGFGYKQDNWPCYFYFVRSF